MDGTIDGIFCLWWPVPPRDLTRPFLLPPTELSLVPIPFCCPPPTSKASWSSLTLLDLVTQSASLPLTSSSCKKNGKRGALGGLNQLNVRLDFSAN